MYGLANHVPNGTHRVGSRSNVYSDIKFVSASRGVRGVIVVDDVPNGLVSASIHEPVVSVEKFLSFQESEEFSESVFQAGFLTLAHESLQRRGFA